MDDTASNERAQGDAPPDRGEFHILRSAAFGIAIADVYGRFLMANAAYLKISGYPETELLSLTLSDLIEEADRPAARELLDQVAAGVMPQTQFQNRHRRKDGRLIWVRLTVSLIPSASASPERLLVIEEDITERRRTEDALKQQHEILKTIFDHVPVLINLTGQDGRIELVNREWERVLGWTLDEIQTGGIDIFAECYPDPRQRREAVDFIAAARRKWTDFKPRARDGRTLDTMWTEVRLSDGTTIGIGAEITERKRAEEALRESEQRLRQLAEHIHEVLWIADRKARSLLYVSPAYERIWGRTCESLYLDPRSFIEAIHPEDRRRFQDAFEEQVRNPIPLEIEYRVIRPDGSVRSILDNSFPVRDDAGEVYRFVGVSEDITEWKRAEERLGRSEAYLAESERLGHIGTWVLEISTGKVAFWSKEQYRIHGFEEAGPPPALEAILAMIHPEDKAAASAIIQAVKAVKSFDLDYRIVLPDSSIRHVRSLGTPFLNDSGEALVYNGISMDVTQSKVAEVALQRSMEQLRALAAKMERVREEERTRLAREVHDELGQALAGIKIELRSMIDHPPQRRERARFQAILKEVDEANQSVRRIATELRPGILDDLGLVAAVEWAAQEFASRTRTTCALSLPLRDLAIEPEVATALFRILQEALSNIAQHAAATEFSVRLAEEDECLRLEVHDNGRGLGPIMPSGSLGILGMKERASLLRGRLTVTSPPEGGTTVSVWIPRH